MRAHLRLAGRGLVAAVVFFALTGTPSQAAPANDLFANRIAITGTNTTTTGSSVGASREPGEPYHAGLSGGASVWWSWQAPMPGTVTISTAGSSFDTVLGVYLGSSVSALSEAASNDDEDYDLGIYTSKVTVDVVVNQICQIAVDGYGGASGSIQLSVRMGPAPPPPPAPVWALPDPHGVMVYSSSYAGKVVIMDYWATWCGPCKVGMPDLVALQAKYRADGLVVVGADVSWSGESAQTVLDFLATWTPTVNYQVVMSNAGAEAPWGGINAIPTTFIVDRQNFIRKKYVGTQTYATLERQIIPLLYRNAQLACQHSANPMTLRWPTNARPFTLESALHPGGSWSPWPESPTVVNGTNTVTVPTTEAARFFRLHMSY